MNPDSATVVPPLNQIALSVVDLRLTERWFREGFGLLPAGGSRLMMRGVLPSMVQGLPKVASTCWWLVGRNHRFQLELFQFESPLAALLPADFRPCDIGYTRIGMWVTDFDATLDALARLDSMPLSPVQGQAGARRACVRSPDGVFVEIMEDDPMPLQPLESRGECPTAIRSITLSTPNLADSCAYFSVGLGLSESTVALHATQHEALWGLAGARCERRIFDGGGILLEVVHYLDPAGKPWPQGYRISDQGILNIAFGLHNKKDHKALCRRAEAFGARPNSRPVHLLVAGATYVNDQHGFSVEIMWTKPGSGDRQWGLVPLPPEQRPDPDNQCVVSKVRIDASVERVWETIADHEGMSRWSGFSPVTLIRRGMPDAAGYGAQRLVRGPIGVEIIEQVVAATPPHSMRYRVIKGSPFSCYQGEVRLVPCSVGSELHWTVRFRSKLPGMGWLLKRILQSKLDAVLEHGLKPLLESNRT